MASRRARTDSASSLLSAFALAALAAWSHPALASSGIDTLSDQSAESVPATEIPHAPLRMHEVDHGAANAVSAGGRAIDDEVDASSTRRLRPRTDIILKRIFDDARLAGAGDAQSADPDALGAPLADEQSSDADETAGSSDMSSAGQMATQLPGVSDDELHRFRQRMYRVDI